MAHVQFGLLVVPHQLERELGLPVLCGLSGDPIPLSRLPCLASVGDNVPSSTVAHTQRRTSPFSKVKGRGGRKSDHVMGGLGGEGAVMGK